MRKDHSVRVLLFIVLCFTFFGQPGGVSADENQVLEKYYELLHRGEQLSRDGNNQEALKLYQRALGLAKNKNGEAVARGAIIRLYEKIGDYGEALQEVEWFLARDLTAPGRRHYEAARQRLLQKIEEQKRGGAVSGAVVNSGSSSVAIHKTSDFLKAPYGEQKQFLEKRLPESSDVHRLAKQAMLAEHAGKFVEAKTAYEQLLLKKDEVEAALGVQAWVMLHPSVQRTSELVGDEAREKEMLIWIRDFMMTERSAYRQHLQGLLPDVQDHLKSRLKRYSL